MGEVKTVGTIGQMYENRQSGKLGKLVERNDKFRTLLMESPEGDTFNISFASLKSNWRKYIEPEVKDVSNVIQMPESDELIYHSVVIEEPEKEPEKEPEEKKIVKFHKSRTLMFEELQDRMIEFTVDLGKDNPYFCTVVMPHRRGVAVKFINNRFLEIYTRTNSNSYQLFVKEETFRGAGLDELLNIKLADVSYREDYYLNTFFKFSEDRIDDVLNAIKEYLFKKIETMNQNNTEQED